MPAFLLRPGEGKIVALYTRCEDELLCRAELLMLLGEVDARVPPALAHGPVHGYYDVDPTFTRAEFLSPYRRDPAKQARLLAAQRTLAENGWNFPALPETAEGPERSRRAPRRRT